MPKNLLRKKDVTKAKNINLKFILDCKEPKEDKVINLDEFVNFLKERIKVNGRAAGKTGQLNEDIGVSAENDKVVVTATVPFSKRYLKYLTKKYLKQETLREYLYVHASEKNVYQLKYFNIAQDEAEK